MKENEIDEYLFNYIYRGAKLYYLDKSNFNHPRLFENLARSVKLDRPDLYFIDHESKTIYIYLNISKLTLQAIAKKEVP